MTCQERSAKSVKPPAQETDIPPYPFAKIGLDLSGPYPQTLSGNRYIISFIDLYSGWPEAFADPDKSAENIAHLLIEEIFPRHGAPLQIISDNGSENSNRMIKETLEALNVLHPTIIRLGMQKLRGFTKHCTIFLQRNLMTIWTLGTCI